MGFNPVVWAANRILTIPLVLGAELKCSCGSKHRYLLLETDDIDINGVPKACVDDCKALTNIRPFGTCSDGSSCTDCMELEAEWENPEPQNEFVNGKEIITTKSFLLCNAKGGTIEAVTSGQEHAFSFHRALMLFAEMEKDYPGLFDQLLDPHGSLYLEEGMYENAIKFLRNYLEEKGGEVFLAGIYDMKDPKDLLVVAVLDRLLTDCEGDSYDRLINGLENIGAQTRMNQAEGWDIYKLNEKMIDMLEIDSINTAEKINTSSFARWTEEHKKFVSIMGDTVLKVAYAAMIWRCATASSATRAAVSKGGTKTIHNISELSNEQIEALIKYTGDDYININNSLRGIETLASENQVTVEAMKSTLSNSALSQDMILYRGTSTEALGSLKNLPTNELVGKQFVEKGFMSTSTSNIVADGFTTNMHMTIEASKGAQALDITSISLFPEEAEVLFNAGQEMTIKTAVVKDEILHITVTIP